MIRDKELSRVYLHLFSNTRTALQESQTDKILFFITHLKCKFSFVSVFHLSDTCAYHCYQKPQTIFLVLVLVPVVPVTNMRYGDTRAYHCYQKPQRRYFSALTTTSSLKWSDLI